MVSSNIKGQNSPSPKLIYFVENWASIVVKNYPSRWNFWLRQSTFVANDKVNNHKMMSSATFQTLYLNFVSVVIPIIVKMILNTLQWIQLQKLKKQRLKFSHCNLKQLQKLQCALEND